MIRRRMFAALGLALTVTASVALTGCAPGGTGEVAADCTPKHEFTTISEGTLSVVLYDLPPFAKLDNGKVTGVDGDILTAFAAEECLTITATSAATSANIPTVQAGRADVSIAAWYRTQARSEIVLLTDPIYTDQMAIISKDGLSTITDLEGELVGTVDGYLWVEDMRAVLGDKLKVYPTTLNMNQDLQAGRISIGIDSYGSAVHNNTDGGFTVEVVQPDERVAASKEAAQICIPVAPGNEALATAINEFVAEIREDGRLAQMLVDNGLDASAAETGPARLI